ncbi:glycoside hydrolase family 26 protein [Thermoactinospora rubra]|uniref:glycoside hydrolase family 26 protein n=1 Tax=Thermoactinospora rubra TaxID=1088767 RepID=UPI00197E9A2F|nr:glycosyl hydrolase [Thermoactinospora rubra]
MLGVAVLSVAVAGAQQAMRSELPNGAGKAALGVFLGSDFRGVARVPGFEAWLGREVTVGRTYLPGETWESLRGPGFILDPWTRWKSAKPGRVLAINVPMIAPNESGMSDFEVSVLLRAGAAGAFDLIFQDLATKLVAAGAGDSVIVIGWEMNGTTYSSRCAPNPPAWKEYWRRIVTSMRSVPGQSFRFDFTPNRGSDAIAWTACYPGDDVVDIIGMDVYDQAPGRSFSDYVNQPYGLRHHAEFAAAHGKPMSFPEWGLFRYGDRPEYVREMLDWIATHNVAYHSISDYCPHGVWQCPANSRSADVYRRLLRAQPNPSPTPTSTTQPTQATSQPPTQPGTPPGTPPPILPPTLPATQPASQPTAAQPASPWPSAVSSGLWSPAPWPTAAAPSRPLPAVTAPATAFPPVPATALSPVPAPAPQVMPAPGKPVPSPTTMPIVTPRPSGTSRS